MLSLREVTSTPHTGLSVTTMMFATETAAVPSSHLPRNSPADVTNDSENAVSHAEEHIPLETIRARSRDG